MTDKQTRAGGSPEETTEQGAPDGADTPDGAGVSGESESPAEPAAPESSASNGDHSTEETASADGSGAEDGDGGPAAPGGTDGGSVSDARETSDSGHIGSQAMPISIPVNRFGVRASIGDEIKTDATADGSSQGPSLTDAGSAPGHRPAGVPSAAAGAGSPPPAPPVGQADAATEEISVPTDAAAGDEQPPKRRGRRAAIIVGAVILVLGVAYGVTYLLAGDKLARNATVAGIDVGGLTADEAEARLAEELPAVVDAPIILRIGDSDATYEIVPSEAGLGIDVPASVAAVPGGSPNPVSLVRSLFDGGEVDPVPDVDEDALRGSLEAIADQSDTEPVNASVAFEEGEVVTSDPATGRSLDVDGAVDVVRSSFFGSEARELPIGELTMPVNEVEPDVTAAELETAVADFAEPAMSGPVTVAADGESVDLSPDLIGQALSMTPDESGNLQPDLDGDRLAELASDELEEIGQEGQDATVRIENGAPVVVPSEAGKGIETDSLGDVVLLALTEEGDARRAEVELTDVEPELTTAGAEDLGVNEVVAEFTTNFPPAEYRDVNIGRAAELIDNTFLEPGDEFSMNGIVGERTEANGFTSGTIINQGRLEDAMGGGVSQVATTTFHAAFQAGLEDVEHWPHSIYFDRYPIAQEATVAWGAKDLRFSNDTPYGVLVDTVFTPSAGSGQGSLTVRIWSTEYYDVKTSVSERRDHTSPRTIYDTSDNCEPQSGSGGFSITSFREVRTPDGELVKDEADPWTYNPNHTVVCGPDPDAEGDDD